MVNMCCRSEKVEYKLAKRVQKKRENFNFYKRIFAVACGSRLKPYRCSAYLRQHKIMIVLSTKHYLRFPLYIKIYKTYKSVNFRGNSTNKYLCFAINLSLKKCKKILMKQNLQNKIKGA